MMSSCRAVFKNNLAYTEDNILIYNIFVFDLSKKCTENMLRSYFTQFGEVIGVHKKLATASVHFKDACSAYKALVHSKQHQLRGTRISVEAADSWEQPHPDKVLGRTGRYNGNFSEPPSNALTLLSLNDDCLEIICGVLELRDQVNFARVCPRFKDVFKMFSKRKYKTFDLINLSTMTLWEIRDFFRFSGEYIEAVSIYYEYENAKRRNSDETNGKRIIEFIRLSCKNLKRITIKGIRSNRVQPAALNKLLRSFRKLVELRLYDCELNDTTVKSLLHLKNLDTLVISENGWVTGKFLSALPQLKKLCLYECNIVQTKYLIQICKAMKNLKSLDVQGCELLTTDFFETMADYCNELEVLKMSCPYFSFDCVARLPRLKHLELAYINLELHNTFLTTFLTELVAHKADQLEGLKCLDLSIDHFTAISELKQLKIFSYMGRSLCDEALRILSKLELLEELVIQVACYITNEALLRLLQNCTRLHLLDIDYCDNISTKFIAEAIDILKNRKEKSIKPLTIFASWTSIEESALAKCPIYESALKSGIIKVIFRPCETEKFDYTDEDSFWGLQVHYWSIVNE